MKKLFLLAFLIPIQVFSQDSNLPEEPSKYVSPKYYELGAGISTSRFRDFATSPLIYSGAGGEFTAGIVRKDDKVESNLAFRFATAVYGTAADRREQTPASASSIWLSYSRLYRVFSMYDGKFNLKVGGKIDLTGNIRQNPSFMNSSFGLESFQTLFGSAKITNDISRNEVKHKKFLFIRYKLKPKKREISLQFNASVLNTTYRNGYAYLNQSAIKGSNDAFEGYKFSTFSGLRMSSALEWTRFLKNGNGIRYSYIWDAYKSGGDLPKFEMSNRFYQLSLLFRVK